MSDWKRVRWELLRAQGRMQPRVISGGSKLAVHASWHHHRDCAVFLDPRQRPRLDMNR